MSRSGKRRRLAGAGVALLGMTLLGAAAGHLVTRAPAEPGSYGVREVPAASAWSSSAAGSTSPPWPRPWPGTAGPTS